MKKGMEEDDGDLLMGSRLNMRWSEVTTGLLCAVNWIQSYETMKLCAGLL